MIERTAKPKRHNLFLTLLIVDGIGEPHQVGEAGLINIRYGEPFLVASQKIYLGTRKWRE